MSDRAYAKAQAPQKTLIGPWPKSSLLQRTCACGQHAFAGRECSTCRNEQPTQRTSGSPSTSTPAQENAAPVNLDSDGTSHFGHDFSQIPIYPAQRAVLQTKLKV